MDWELQTSLRHLARRLSGPADSRRLLTWLIGRSGWPEGLELDPW